MTSFINGVKQQQICSIHEQLKSLKNRDISALDLGCGKGQDIMKFQDYADVVCVDNDKYALWELNQRTSALKTKLRVKTV